MEFDIRPLRFKDVAPMARIVGKIGIREFKDVLDPAKVSALVESADGDDGSAVEAVGMAVAIDAAAIILENYGKAEGDIAAFLASMAGMTADEVMELPIADALNLAKAVLSAPEFSDFFKRASALAR